jgi:hypothetical protein
MLLWTPGKALRRTNHDSYTLTRHLTLPPQTSALIEHAFTTDPLVARNTVLKFVPVYSFYKSLGHATTS